MDFFRSDAESFFEDAAERRREHDECRRAAVDHSLDGGLRARRESGLSFRRALEAPRPLEVDDERMISQRVEQRCGVEREVRDDEQSRIAAQERAADAAHREEARHERFGVRSEPLDHAARVLRDIFCAGDEAVHFDARLREMAHRLVVEAIETARIFGEPLHTELQRADRHAKRTLRFAEKFVHQRIAIERAIDDEACPDFEDEERPDLSAPVVHAAEVFGQNPPHELRPHPSAVEKRAVVERRAHVWREFAAQPARGGHDESALAPVEHRRRNEACGEHFKYVLRLEMLQANRRRNRRGVFDERAVEERRARLEAVRHRRAIRLHEQLIGKVRAEIAVECAIDVVGAVGGLPDRAIQRVRRLVLQRTKELVGIRLGAIRAEGAIIRKRVGSRASTGACEQRKAPHRALVDPAERASECAPHRGRQDRSIRHRDARDHRPRVAAEELVAAVAVEGDRHLVTRRAGEIVVRDDRHVGKGLSVVPYYRWQVGDERRAQRLFLQSHPQLLRDLAGVAPFVELGFIEAERNRFDRRAAFLRREGGDQ